MTIDFNRPDLAKAVEALDKPAIDQLPFGVIKLDGAGEVTLFNATEARDSGYGDRPSVGQDFFLKVAPCMSVPEFLGRIEQAKHLGAVDIELGWIGDFNDRDREMQVRVQSAADGGLWIFNMRG
jgi:photoactive yellow protein